MKLLKRDVLDEFKRKHAEVCSQVDTWICEVEEAQWQSTHDIKRKYASASFLGGYQVVFNFKGNKFRLLVKVNYKSQIVFVEKYGTHAEYSRWNLD